MGRESQGCPMRTRGGNDHFRTDQWMEVIISPRDNLSENIFFVDLCGGVFTFFVRRRSSKGPRRDGLSSRRVTATW